MRQKRKQEKKQPIFQAVFHTFAYREILMHGESSEAETTAWTTRLRSFLLLTGCDILSEQRKWLRDAL